MWVTFALTIIIGASWFIKMVLQRRITIQRTPMDIPIALFLTSQVISTIFSWDNHVSFWGYYSRFNGGLLSIATYIFLYYAFLSNFYFATGLRATSAVAMVKRLLFVALLSGLVVALWGLPSHFGYDPTCLLFRGTLDVSCWTEDFQPKIRIFSTLGQPAWLAAYLAILLPISIIMFIKFIKNLPLSIFYLLLSILFYLALLYTRARSGIIAVWISLIFLFSSYFWISRKKFYILHSTFYILLVLLVLLIITFFIGQPFSHLDKFTFKTAPQIEKPRSQAEKDPSITGGGTESGEIRKIVWQGAINIWKEYPIFGTGVETFAFAYYKYKPPEHNLTSEWNFLYNKAHNEYLNYLATTGTVGLGTYLLMIGWFMFITIKKISKSEFLISKEVPNPKSQLGQLEIRSIRNLVLALLAGYLSILITNFFGFSVVITNIYLFLIPAFIFTLDNMINPENAFVFPGNKAKSEKTSTIQWVAIFILILTTLYLILALFRFWVADTNYAYGQGLDRAGKHTDANSYLRSAYSGRNDEPVFKDGLAINDANIAVDILNAASKEKLESDTTKIASGFAQEAIDLSNDITSKHPNNVVFWKNRVRLFYTLSQADSTYFDFALSAIKKAGDLAPNDASISYNLGILYGQNDDVKNGIKTLENTIRLKPDYKDAHFALGLFYRQQALDKNGKVINPDLQEKAVGQMQYILNHLSPNDPAAKEALENWK